MSKYDAVVIGGGVGGYPAAIRFAQRGLKVALVEQEFLGGECTNYGCVPSKALYRIAYSFDSLLKVTGRTIGVDWRVVREWVRSIVTGTREGIGYLLEKYGVEVYYARANLKDKSGCIKLSTGKEIYGDKIVLSLGTDPRPLKNIGFDREQGILSNRDIFYVDELPSSIAIVGGGVIGVEIAYSLSRLGVDVVLIEALKRILPMMDADVSRAISRYLGSRGVKIHVNTTVTGIDRGGDSILLKLSNGSRVEVDKVLVSIGRTPRTRDVGLEEAGVDVNDYGYIRLYMGYRTSNPRIYAAGDVTGPPLLAQKALVESVLAAENALGRDVDRLDPYLIPSVVFTGLEVGSIGYSEGELRARGIKYRRVRIPIGFLPGARVKDGEYGFVKVLIGDGDRVYGVHIVAPNASEVISAFIPFYMGRLSVEELATMPYPHMTISEVIRDFAEYLLGEPIHLFIRK